MPVRCSVPLAGVWVTGCPLERTSAGVENDSFQTSALIWLFSVEPFSENDSVEKLVLIPLLTLP